MALHFHTWETTFNYVRRLFVLPPRYLTEQMEQDIKNILKKKTANKKKGPEELDDVNMNSFFGTVVGE